ncbi:aldehyde dehydrogenase [Mesorhizobium sp. Root695]|uniref:aldehyde dehydrogenase n=1 Tax=Mesorhizobium sp. Root695 TaxID=1736589 RepID=UPI0007109FDF|nr:aldehyde dehydrogenase [Mesorhizobium sp. Root695]KRB19137.1 aldehyde dehydrogenase [Mesorhizobium sp. Root695]
MAVEDKKSYLMLIDGKFVTGEAGMRSVINPANGKAFVDVPEASPDQARQAIEAARMAQKSWGLKSPLARAVIMKRIAVLIRQNARRLAEVVVREQGKPINEAIGEVGGAAEFFDYYAEFARRIQGEILPSDYAGEQVWIQRVPVGVVAAIIPWNYPSALVSRKVAPAMIAGDTIVLKPHEDTPLSALEMARIFVEAGVPAGVVNIITGRGETIGEVLCTEPGVDLITMTGSVPTGKRIMANASRNLTPVSLELGGKAPFIVLADADLELAVRSAATSRYMNCGQVCICNERTLVHRSIYDQFVTRFVEFSKSLVVGDPMQANTDIGPKVSREELEKVEAVLAEAVAGGARLALAGGRPIKAPIDGGYWLNPTVLTDVTPDMPIMTREIFGPVVPIMPFDTFEEAVSVTNASNYGLSAYLFTNDLGRVMNAVNEVSFGEIYVNRIGPEMLQGFHVGFRESGLGGDDGVHGLESYMRKKTVYVNYSGAATAALMPYGR